MKKTTLLWIAVIMLFLLNAGTLFFLWSRPGPPPDGPPGPGHRGGHRQFDHELIETLQLNPDQVEKFDQMKRAHHEQMLELDEATKAPFEQYFALLIQPADAAAKDSLEKVVGDLYRKRMQVTFQHFSELKAICTPEQQQKFKQMLPSLMQVMSSGEKNMPPPRRKP